MHIRSPRDMMDRQRATGSAFQGARSVLFRTIGVAIVAVVLADCPPAIVAVGGLLSSTLLTLIVLPTLYRSASQRGYHKELHVTGDIL